MNGDKRTVLANISYLSILNALNLALPLLLIPYLTNTIGFAHFADYSYVYAIVFNMMMLTQYGFNFSATRLISLHRDDRDYVCRLFNAVIAAKLLIAVVAFVALLALTPVLFRTPERLFLFVTAMGIVVGDAFVPVWLFQGMERMKYVTIANATARVIFTGLVFLLITRPDQYKYVLALDSLGYLVAGAVSVALAYGQFGMRLRLPSVADVKFQFREGFTIFCSTFFINMYRNANVFLLDFFVTPESLGYYAVAEKVVKAAQSVVTPISQALFPHMGKRFGEHSLSENLATLWRVARLLVLLTIVMALGLDLCSGYIHLVVGKDFLQAHGLLYIMSPILVFGALNYLLGFVGLVNLGCQRWFFRSVMVSGIVSLSFLVTCAPMIGITAAAISMLVSELALFAMCVWGLGRLSRNA